MSKTAVSVEAGLESLVARVVDEFLDRQRRGERPVASDYAGRYPEAAGLLREVLAALEIAGLSGPGGAAGDGGSPLNGTLGDFRIVREIGRGGMGIVYDAEQISLNRRVALKVLPFAAMLDPKQLQRFKNEARAAASLHHQHIVPVYGVGCERGVHFYAMQLIDGKSLAVLIRQLRGEPASPGGEPPSPKGDGDLTTSFPGTAPPPTEEVAALATQASRKDRTHYRNIAEMIAQAADALEHAHSLGIVHRDVKPANLILDDAGHLWVTEFGLARFGSDADLTMTGDLLGTLRYMSPEQALAKHGLVDHRTDVYSLGATLYELLTLLPAMAGADKQEILRKIAFEEPKLPRSVDRSIPAELETITLKALAKEPTERYATAGELAGDLRRWLGHLTIQARPPGLRQRVAKWARRHPGVTATAGISAALLLGLVIAGLAVNNALIQGEQKRTQDALNLAVQSERRTQDALGLAFHSAKQMLFDIGDVVGDAPGLEQTQRKVLQSTVAIYEGLADYKGDAQEVERDRGLAQFRLGMIHDRLGDLKKGGEAYTQAADIFGRLAAQAPGNVDYRYWQAHSLAEHGELCDRLGNGKAAEDLARQAYELFQQAAEKFPDDILIRSGLADCCLVLGSVNFSPGLWMRLFRPDYSARRWKECDRLLREALSLYPAVVADDEPNRSDHRWRFHRTQKLLSQMPKVSLLSFQERERLAKDSVTGFEALVKEFPRQHRPRVELCEALVWRGELSEAAGRPAEAESLNRHALAIADKLVKEYPKVRYYPLLHASAQYVTGSLLVDLDRLDDAQPLLRQAAATLESTPEGLAPRFQLWKEAARCYRRLGIGYEQVGRLEEAETAQRHALRLDEQVVRDNPNTSNGTHLGYDAYRLAAMLSRRGSPLDGIEVHRAHTEFWTKQADGQPVNSLACLSHYHSFIGLGQFLRESGLLLQRPDLLTQADQAYRESQNVGARLEESGLLDPAPEEEWAFAYRDSWKWLQIHRSWLYQKARGLDEAEEVRRQIVWHAQQVEAAAPGKPDPGREVAEAVWDLARFLGQALGRRPASITAYRETISEFDRLAAKFPSEVGNARQAAGARMELAFVHQLGGNADEARRVADEAVTLLGKLATSDKPWNRQELALRLADLAIIRWRAGRVEDATAAMGEAVAIMDNLLADRSSAAQMRSAWEDSMAIVTARHAYLFEHTGHLAEAQAAYKRSASLRRGLAEAVVPGEWFGRETRRTPPGGEMNKYVRARRNLVVSLMELAMFHLRRGQVDQADSYCAEGLAVLEKMVEAYPADPAALNQLAWFLVTCPVKNLRDPARAVKLARKAAAPVIENNWYVSTLGAALYRTGDFRAAVTT
jgi:serine/threonine protein kinase